MAEGRQGKRVACAGIVGDTALGFLAGLGIASVLDDSPEVEQAAIGWCTARWEAHFTGVESMEQIAAAIERDRLALASSKVFSFSYPKLETNGVKAFKGLRAPLGIWRHWLQQVVASRDQSSLQYAAVLANEVSLEEVPAKKRVSSADMLRFGVQPELANSVAAATMPTFFDFTSRNAQFLDQANVVRASLDEQTILMGLVGRDLGVTEGRTLGWDSAVDRPAALYSYGRPTNPVLEWLAFRGLVFFPLAGSGRELEVTSCRGRRKNGTFSWPLWNVTCPVAVVRALLKTDWTRVKASARAARGVSQVFESGLAKAADGYSGIFTPSRPA